MKIIIKLDVAKEAKRRARQEIGAPSRGRVVPDKRRKAPKHKEQYLRTIDR